MNLINPNPWTRVPGQAELAQEAALDEVERAEQIMKDALLKAIAEIRSIANGVPHGDALIDGVVKHFHPDALSDNFSDAFEPMRKLIDRVM